MHQRILVRAFERAIPAEGERGKTHATQNSREQADVKTNRKQLCNNQNRPIRERSVDAFFRSNQTQTGLNAIPLLARNMAPSPRRKIRELRQRSADETLHE